MKKLIHFFIIGVIFVSISAGSYGCAKEDAFIDESASPVAHILKFSDGTSVETIEQWRQRREEILEIFKENVYGHDIFGGLSFISAKVESSLQLGVSEGIFRDKVLLTYANDAGEIDIHLYVYRKKETPDAVKPLLLQLSHSRDFNFDTLPQEDIESTATTVAIKTFLNNGFNVALLDLNSVALNAPVFESGVFTLVKTSLPNQARTVGAWAWGASKAVDYLYTTQYTDKDKIAVLGHSRSGKAALWAGACDERITAVISNDSGCTGAALSYNATGETIQKINTNFPHWFCDNYKNFNSKQNELPFDQHMLLASIAPRLLYVASSSVDFNADPANELYAAQLAYPAYGLYGKKNLEKLTEETIQLDKGYHGGQISYHRKAGPHSLSYVDWLLFLEFFKTKNWI